MMIISYNYYLSAEVTYSFSFICLPFLLYLYKNVLSSPKDIFSIVLRERERERERMEEREPLMRERSIIGGLPYLHAQTGDHCLGIIRIQTGFAHAHD